MKYLFKKILKFILYPLVVLLYVLLYLETAMVRKLYLKFAIYERGNCEIYKGKEFEVEWPDIVVASEDIKDIDEDAYWNVACFFETFFWNWYIRLCKLSVILGKIERTLNYED